MATRNKKYTVMLPKSLVDSAMKAAGQDKITPVIERGLELVAREGAYERLLALRGKVKFSLDFNKLRDDDDRG